MTLPAFLLILRIFVLLLSVLTLSLDASSWVNLVSLGLMATWFWVSLVQSGRGVSSYALSFVLDLVLIAGSTLGLVAVGVTYFEFAPQFLLEWGFVTRPILWMLSVCLVFRFSWQTLRWAGFANHNRSHYVSWGLSVAVVVLVWGTQFLNSRGYL